MQVRYIDLFFNFFSVKMPIPSGPDKVFTITLILKFLLQFPLRLKERENSENQFEISPNIQDEF